MDLTSPPSDHVSVKVVTLTLGLGGYMVCVTHIHTTGASPASLRCGP